MDGNRSDRLGTLDAEDLINLVRNYNPKCNEALLRGAFFAACDNDMWEIMGVIGSLVSVSRRFYQITAQIRWDRSDFF